MRISRLPGLCLLIVTALTAATLLGQDALEKLQRKVDMPLDPPGVAVADDTVTGYLGMTVDLTAPEGKSVFIVSVVPGAPAAEGGLLPDDQIMTINGRPIGSLEDLDRALRQPAGTKLEFKVRREGVPQRFDVMLAKRPAEAIPPAPVAELPAPADPTEPAEPVAKGERANLGISVADISELTRRRFGVVVESGAVISQIERGSAAEQAGLPLGGVIVSINGKRIGSVRDVVDLVRAFRPGEQIDVTYFEGDRIVRKSIALGAAADEAARASRRDPGVAVEPRTDPPLRLGRRPGGRPVLEALERTLDIVLPPSGTPRSEDNPPPPPAAVADPTLELPPMELEPPPPPVPAAVPRAVPRAATPAAPATPTLELPSPAGRDELSDLRQQLRLLQRQLEQIQRRIDELEAKRTSGDDK